MCRDMIYFLYLFYECIIAIPEIQIKNLPLGSNLTGKWS